MVYFAEVRHPLENAGARFLQTLRDRDHFLVGGADCRRQIAVAGTMGDRARGGKANGARLDRVADDRAHFGDFGVGGRFPLRAALAHDIDTDRAMRHLHRHIDIVWQVLDGIQIIGKALPLP